MYYLVNCQQTTSATAKLLHCCAHHLWSELQTMANNQWDLTTKHVLDSYNKCKKETQVIVGISVFLLVKQEWPVRVQAALAGRVHHALIQLCNYTWKETAMRQASKDNKDSSRRYRESDLWHLQCFSQVSDWVGLLQEICACIVGVYKMSVSLYSPLIYCIAFWINIWVEPHFIAL